MVTEIKDDKSTTVISLHDWRAKNADLVQQRRTEAEYASLQFPELIQKTQDLIDNLKNDTDDLEMAKKSLAMLQEIRRRIESDGLLSGEVARMIEEISARQSILF